MRRPWLALLVAVCGCAGAAAVEARSPIVVIPVAPPPGAPTAPEPTRPSSSPADAPADSEDEDTCADTAITREARAHIRGGNSWEARHLLRMAISESPHCADLKLLIEVCQSQHDQECVTLAEQMLRELAEKLYP